METHELLMIQIILGWSRYVRITHLACLNCFFMLSTNNNILYMQNRSRGARITTTTNINSVQTGARCLNTQNEIQ